MKPLQNINEFEIKEGFSKAMKEGTCRPFQIKDTTSAVKQFTTTHHLTPIGAMATYVKNSCGIGAYEITDFCDSSEEQPDGIITTDNEGNDD